MLGRAPALALSDTLAQRGFDLLPGSIIAQRVIVGKTFVDVMNVDRRDLRSNDFPIGALPLVLARPPTGHTNRGHSAADWVRPRHASDRKASGTAREIAPCPQG